MATGTGNLPNQNMDFESYATLPASDLDKLVSNIEALADGSGVGDGSVTNTALADASVTNAKLSTTAGDIGGISLAWVPTNTGFSSAPANGIYTATKIGKWCILTIDQPTNGTSNATTFTISLPFTAKTLTNALWVGYGTGIDNNVGIANPALLTISSAGTVINVYTNWAGAAWTNSGNKRLAQGTIIYEIA